MSREDWVAIRQASIGTSDFASALGYSPWKTPYELWEEKMNGAKDIHSFRFQQGHLYEKVVRHWFTEKTGLKVVRDKKIRIHKDYDYLTTNLDGIVRRDDGVKSAIEIKTVDPMIYRHWEDRIPLYYQIQAQGQMAITGFDSVFFAIQIGFHDYKIEEVKFFIFNNSIQKINSKYPYTNWSECIILTNNAIENLNRNINLNLIIVSLFLEIKKVLNLEYINTKETKEWLNYP